MTSCATIPTEIGLLFHCHSQQTPAVLSLVVSWKPLQQCGFRFEWTFSLTKLVCVGVSNEVSTFTLKLTKQSFVGFKSL